MSYLEKGFTLIEILVVILIVGITLGFALVSFGDFGEKRRIIMAAEQFNHYIQLAQQQAILDTSILGVKITKGGYQIVQFQAPDKWPPLSRGVFHAQPFPTGLIFNLKSDINERKMPAIIINSSGEMTAFTLDFGSEKQAVIMTVIGDRNGVLHRVKSR